MKTCPKCKEEKSVDCFSKSRASKDGLQRLCKPCHRQEVMDAYYKNPDRVKIAAKKWAAKHPEERREITARHRESLRNKVYDHYGRECKKCGERIQDFLTIDHANGGGNAHRKQISRMIFRWLIKHNFPSGFRVLCANCNAGGYLKKLKNPDKYMRRNKVAAFAHYGTKCSCCKNNDLAMLNIRYCGEGKNPGGKIGLYRWLIQHDFPDGFETVCWNCAQGKRKNNGVCPHKLKR